MEMIKKYACVDLEVSGFDPRTEEILEIAIQIFQLEGGSLVPLESYETLIKPTVKVSQRIFDLTGIDPVEIETAPTLGEVKESLVNLLDGTIILGHGVMLDTGFLKAKEIINSDAVSLDTLEIAQVLLPSHHSYNLENLSHLFGYTYKNIHRAMSDVGATMALLENFSELFHSLSKETKSIFLSAEVSVRLPWVLLLSELQTVIADRVGFTETPTGDKSSFGLYFKENVSSRANYLYAHSSMADARKLVENVAGGHEIFSPSVVTKKKLMLLHDELPNLSLKILLGYLKVLVYLDDFELKDGSDLNWTMLGRDVAGYFTEKNDITLAGEMLHTDFTAINKVHDKKRKLVICNTPAFVEWMEYQIGKTVSWGGIVSSLHSIYNPATSFGNENLAEKVIEALVYTDICFASIILLFKKHYSLAEGVMDLSNLDPFVLKRIHIVLKNFEKRLMLLGLANEPEIYYIFQNIDFFTSSKELEFVSWVDFSDSRCVFISKPISLKGRFNELQSQFKSVEFLQPNYELLLEEYIYSRFEAKLLTSCYEVDKIQVNYEKLSTKEDFVARILRERNRSLWIFMSNREVKENYDHILKLNTSNYKALVQGIHGGPMKISRNRSWKTEYDVWLSINSIARLPVGIMNFESIFFIVSELEELSLPYLKAISSIHLGYMSGEEWLADLYLFKILSALKVVAGCQSITMVDNIGKDGSSLFKFLENKLSTQI